MAFIAGNRFCLAIDASGVFSTSYLLTSFKFI